MALMGPDGALSKGVAEFFAMLLFVFIGCGTAMTPTRTVFQIALAFGMGIVILAYSIGAKTGGHVNCAVTTALMVAGKCAPLDGIVIIIFQLLGSFVGAALLAATIPSDMDATKCFATNQVATGFSNGNAFCGEFFFTFLLLFVVFHTAVHERYRNGVNNAAPLAIGMAVFCAHCVLIPIDGCSINPTRSFGPAILASIRTMDGTAARDGGSDGCDQWKDFWIFVVAPEAAAIFAGLMYRFWWSKDEVEEHEPGHRDPTKMSPRHGDAQEAGM